MITIDNRSGFELSYATTGSAGFDVKANEDVDVAPGATVCVSTGLYMTCSDRFDYLDIRPKSGLASRGLFAILGLIDSDFRHEIKVIFHNSTKCQYHIQRGDKIANAVAGVYHHVLGDVHIAEYAREGGFGSTGK